MNVQVIAVIGEELASAVDLEGVGLVQGGELVQAGFDARVGCVFGGGLEDALGGFEISYFVGFGHFGPVRCKY